jgi:hypothetical protein
MMQYLKEYMYKVADYIDMEYGNVDDGYITDDEKYTIKNIIAAHYDENDSINNTANAVALYIRDSRAWTQENN